MSKIREEKTMLIYCCNCNKEIDCYLTNGKEIYPHRQDLHNLKFYKCPYCGGYIGVHKGTEKPLGVIASTEIKKYRIKIHSILDPLWKTKKYKRKYLYDYISEKLNYRYHTANLKTKEECIKVLDILNQLEGEK